MSLTLAIPAKPNRHFLDICERNVLVFKSWAARLALPFEPYEPYHDWRHCPWLLELPLSSDAADRLAKAALQMQRRRLVSCLVPFPLDHHAIAQEKAIGEVFWWLERRRWDVLHRARFDGMNVGLEFWFASPRQAFEFKMIWG